VVLCVVGGGGRADAAPEEKEGGVFLEKADFGDCAKDFDIREIHTNASF